jgi:hypothetical protein
MKNLFFSLAFMLISSFAFANNSNEKIFSIKKEEAIELIKTSTNYEIVEAKSLVDCLLTITFTYTDGTSETIRVLVKGTSCADLFAK